MYLTLSCILFLQSYENNEYSRYVRHSVGYLQTTKTTVSSNIYLSFSKILNYFLISILLIIKNLVYTFNNFLSFLKINLHHIIRIYYFCRSYKLN
jgi:hypothetical protein